MKSRKVLTIAKMMEITGINNLGLLINNMIHGTEYIRAVNYHSTPQEFAQQFEEQMQYYSKYYEPVYKEDLEDLLKGKWEKEKPGLIISFDDGLESNYKYAKPILEKYNFPGWFFIPAGLIGKGYCQKKDRSGKLTERYMDWDQIKELSKNHIIGSHTLTHKRLEKNLSTQRYEQEIYKSKIILEKEIDREVDIFCWVGGEEYSYSNEASDIIESSGYQYSFLTNHYPITKGTNPLQLERTNIEADWPIDLVKMYTSFFMDFKYKRKRERVKKLLK